MIKITADHGNRRVTMDLRDATYKFKRGIGKALTTIGNENKRHTKKLILTGPKTGRFYGSHQASAPGEAPANRTGKLEKSVRYRTYGPLKMEFGDFAFYGKFLELGTKKMKERPHLSRTVKEKERDNYNTLAKFVEEEVVK